MNKEFLDLLDHLVIAVLNAIHSSGITTRHTEPYGETIKVELSKSLITLPIQLDNPAKDLKKMMSLVDIIEIGIAEHFNVSEENRLSVTISRKGKNVLVQVTQFDEPEPLAIEEVGEWLKSDEIFVGLDSHNKPFFHDFWGPLGSMIISGVPGSGKTNTTRFLAAQCLTQRFDGYLIAAKGIEPGLGSSEWLDFKPYLTAIAVEECEADQLLEMIDAECKQRQSVKLDESTRGILLIVDEFFELTKDQQKKLGRLIRLRRTAGLRVILGIKVVSKQVAKDIRGSIGCRIVHRSASPIESQLASGGIANLGGERLDKGCAILISGPNIKRLVIPKADTEDIANIIKTLKPKFPQAPTTDPLAISKWVHERSLSDTVKRGVRGGDYPEDPVYTCPLGDVLRGWLDSAKPNSKLPPRYLLLDALRYYDAYQKQPSFGVLKAWNRRKTGEALSDRRCRAVRNGLRTLLEARRTHASPA